MEFYIEAITAHKGNTKKVSTLTFLVKWLNYSEKQVALMLVQFFLVLVTIK